MAENMIKFLRGNVANLPQTATEGALYFTKDEGVYLGLADGSYHRYGDFITVSDVASLPAEGAHETCMYYCVSENILAKWDGSTWVQINKQKTLAELGGVAKSVYEAKIANLEQADTDNASAISNLESYVGTIPETATATNIVAYVQEKTAGIATDTALEELTGRVATAESDIDALQAATAEGGAVTLAIADAKKAGTDAQAAADAAQAAADAAQADVDALEEKVGTVADGKTVAGLISEAQTQADKGVADAAAAQTAADAAQADVDALEAKVGTVPADKTVVEMIAEAQAAATYDDTDLQERVATIEGDYLKAADKTALQSAIDAEKARAEAAEQENATAIADVKSDVDAFFAAAEVGEAAVDTLKEIQDYITSDGTAAAEMTANIAANASAISAEETRAKAAEQANADAIDALEVTVGDAESGLVKGVADNASAISAEKTRAEAAEAANKALAEAAQAAADAAQDDVDAIAADYLKAADKTELQGNIDAVSGRVTTLEGASHTHANKALLDTYTQTEADLADAVAKKHSHANATVLDGITAEKVSAWDSAQANAEATAASALSTAKTELETEIAKKANSADVYLKTETLSTDEIHALMQWGEF